MNSAIDLLSGLIENKVNVLSDQCNEIHDDTRQYKVLADGTENREQNHQ